MESQSSDSERESPEEFSFKDGKEEAIKQEQLRNKELLSAKKELKRIRRLNHEKNMLQQEEKRKRLEELESKKLPEELLNSIKESVETVKNVPKEKAAKKKMKNKKRKFTDKFVKSVQDSVILEVRPLESENEAANTLQSIAENFRNKKFKSKSINRMPSRELRAIKEKRRHGGRVLITTSL